MIASIKGNLTFKSPNHIIIDVGGIGYQVFVPLSSYYSLPEVGNPLRMNIHTYLKEDAIQLYGFLTKEEKDIFLYLIGITGIGPRLAINILSGISTYDLVKAISEGNLVALNAIPGVGKKTAERLILELREKIGAIQDSGLKPQDSKYEDALSALVNLGYKRSHAEESLKQFTSHSSQLTVKIQDSELRSMGSDLSVEEMIKEALKALHRK